MYGKKFAVAQSLVRSYVICCWLTLTPCFFFSLFSFIRGFELTKDTIYRTVNEITSTTTNAFISTVFLVSPIAFLFRIVHNFRVRIMASNQNGKLTSPTNAKRYPKKIRNENSNNYIESIGIGSRARILKSESKRQ